MCVRAASAGEERAREIVLVCVCVCEHHCGAAPQIERGRRLSAPFVFSTSATRVCVCDARVEKKGGAPPQRREGGVHVCTQHTQGEPGACAWRWVWHVCVCAAVAQARAWRHVAVSFVHAYAFFSVCVCVLVGIVWGKAKVCEKRKGCAVVLCGWFLAALSV